MLLQITSSVVFVLIVIESVLCEDAINLIRGNNILDFASNIINSEPAENGRYKYAQVSIQYPGTASGAYVHQCGGSLIAPDIILTAAHCRNLIGRIYIDVYNLITDKTNATIYTVKNVTVHPQFNKELFRYDFALVHINARLDSIAPIRLNSDSSAPVPTLDLTVLGWGAIQAASSTNNAVYPNIFRKGYVQAMTNENCEATVINGLSLYEGEIFDEMLCAQGQDVDACSGDSGGPLFVEGASDEFDVLVGLVSWGRGCALYPGVYSRISSGYGWIRSEVCYRSVNPPSYMGCQPEERDPVYIDVVDDVIYPTLSPTTKATVAVTVSPVSPKPISPKPVSPKPVSPKPVSATPITVTPRTTAPTTRLPTQFPTNRPSIAPSPAPLIVVNDVAVPTSPSSSPSNATRAAAVPDQQAVSNIMDNDTSLARNRCTNSYCGFLFSLAYLPIFWSVYRW